jgi:probable HAF family extracellular repeat protein
MKNRSLGSSLLIVAFSFTSIAATAASQCPTFTYKDVTVNVSGALETDSYAINDSGVIAGDYIDSTGVQHGMLMKGSQVKTIDNPDCAASTLTFYGVNSTGVAAGQCYLNSTGLLAALVWNQGKFTTLVPPDSTTANASGINDNGDVVGSYTDSSGQQHGFVYSNGKYVKLDPPSDAGLTVGAWSLNNQGYVTIYTESSAPQYLSYVTPDLGKTYIPFAYSGAGSLGTVIHGINNKNGIDGTYYDANSGTHGIAYYKGEFCTLDDPNSTNATRADGINDSFEMVGRYTDSTSGATVGYSVVPNK